MSEWIAPKQWWGRGSNSTGYSSDYYYGKGSGKGSFAEKEQSARRERKKENKKKGAPPKGAAKGSSTQPVEEKSSAVDSKDAGPSYATMLKQNKMPEAKRQQAASAIEELSAESAGEDRAKLLGHLRALIPDASSTASSSKTSLKTRIHRVGNALGKATAKVAKQTEEIELKQRTWEKCSLAIREWAANQRKAFEKDIAEARDSLEKAQKEEKEAMTQLKELQAQLEQQGVEEDPYLAPTDETDLFDTPPTMQPKDTGMTPIMKKLSLELQEANVSDLGRRYPQILARTFVHLAWKQQLLVQEPVTYKGGILVAAYKGRGTPNQCEHYRALMVSSILAKSAHRSLRAESMKSFQTYRLPLQIGGLAGRSVAQGAHCLISYASMCRRAGKSYGILFLDVKQAFYRLFREHIVSVELSDEAVQRLFSTLQLPPDSFQDFAKELAERSAMEAAGSSPYIQAHVREALHGTWFKILGSDRLSQTKRGSRPGDNMADILFAFAFKRILQKVLDQLQQEGCSMQVESLGIAHPYPAQLGAYPLVQFDALGPIWADDLAVLVSEATAPALVAKLQYVGNVLFQHLERAGMRVNFGAGKTEVILDVRGQGALEIRKELFRHHPPMFEFCGRLGQQRFCRLVATYKHLGTVFSQRGRMLPEIRHRLGQARHAFRKHRKMIFGNANLPVKTRTQLFVTLVMSVLQFNIAVWPALTNNEHQAFAGLCLLGHWCIHMESGTGS